MRNANLLFCLTGEYSEEDVRALQGLLRQMAADRAWHRAPPAFVDERDASSCSQPDDVPIRTVGGVFILEAPASVPDRSTETRQLEEVEYLVGRLAGFSRDRQVELELELAGEFIGDIVDGDVSQSISTGLIDEWRRGLS